MSYQEVIDIATVRITTNPDLHDGISDALELFEAWIEEREQHKERP